MAETTLRFSEPDQVKLWASLKDAFAELRGHDVVESPGKNVRIPRTSNNDVRLLISEWTNAVALMATESPARSIARDKLKKLVEKFAKAREEMLAQAAAGDPNATFPANIRFWDSTAKLAIELSSLRVIPSHWELVVEAVGEAAIEAPGTIESALKGGGAAVAGAAKAAAKAAGAIAGAFFEGVWPWALGAAAVYVIAKRKKGN